MRTSLCCLLLSALVAGDGGFFSSSEGKLVSSPRQEAVLCVGDDSVQVILRTHFHAGPEEVAWVVPVPSQPTEIGPFEKTIFDRLDRRTAPHFVFPRRKYGCGCVAKVGDRAPSGESVRVTGSGTAGIYEWTTLEAADEDALARWLRAHGYAVPAGAAATFRGYLGWYWLAMRVRPDLTGEKTLAPHPVTYRYAATDVVFPLAISRVSADAENEVLLYVYAKERYRCANWENGRIEESALLYDHETRSGTNYGHLVRYRTAERGGHVFFTEFAARRKQAALPDTGPYLTRLRAVVQRDAMDKDVRLASMGPDAEAVHNTYHVPWPKYSTAPAGALVVLALFWLACRVSSPRRRGAGTDSRTE